VPNISHLLRSARARGHFDLDLHAGIKQACADHRHRWSRGAKIFAQHRPALWEAFALGHYVIHSHDIREIGACLAKSRLNVLQALLGLVQQALGNGHGVVIEAGGAGYENPLSIDDRP
jgi:hypothetical protein